MSTVAGVDIGGTKITVGTVTRDGRVADRQTVRTPAGQGPAAILDAVTSALRMLDRPFAAVGVGSAGVIDPESGRVRSATDALPGWPGTDLRGELARRLEVQVAVDNDVHAHALGEVWRGAAQGVHTVLYVAVGTGVGSSLVLDGQVHHGANAVAGHAGHIPVPEAVGEACTCGGGGHVEAVASGPAMLAEFRRRAHDVTTLAEVSRLAEQGDGVATSVLERGAVALGRAVGGLVNVLDPDLVLVGGGVSACGDAWWGPLRAAVVSEALSPLKDVPLVTGALGGDAAVVGAGKLGWDALRGGKEEAVTAQESPCAT